MTNTTQTTRCDWNVGTAFAGHRACGKPARLFAEQYTGGPHVPVCGTHARSAKHWGGKTYPLDETDGTR